jgi:MATE family multidrug resistance protein
MGIGFMSITGLIFILGKSFLPGLYINEEEVVNIASSLLVIAAFFQISDGIQVVGLGALRGLEDVRVPTIIAVIAYWLIGLPFGYFLCFELELGARGIWFGLLTGLSMAAIMLSYRFNLLTNRLL